jgi:nucleoid DNA-binding protein
MSTIQKAARHAGVDQVICPHCGSKFSTIDTIKLFFNGVLEMLRRGERVSIPGFGSFNAKLWQGRSHKTPIIPGGVLQFGDTWVVRFKQSKNARTYLNSKPEDRNDDTGSA